MNRRPGPGLALLETQGDAHDEDDENPWGEGVVLGHDPAHTLVQFGVRHLMISTVRGHFTTVAGTAQVDEHDLTASNAEATIAVNSIDTRQPDRDAHLKSPDFLDAERHPAIHFRSTRVSHGRPGGLLMTGELTIRGVTREVVLR